jgi:hypothetical protein
MATDMDIDMDIDVGLVEDMVPVPEMADIEILVSTPRSRTASGSAGVGR